MTISNLCTCGSCSGSNCTCGCQKADRRTGCRCGATCNCGANCSCQKS